MIINDACTINVLTIVIDDEQLSLIALASVVNNDRKWCCNLEHHLLTTLAVSIMIVICL